MSGTPKLARGLCIYATVMRELTDRPRTCDELRADLGGSAGPWRRMTRRMLDLGLLCVVEWRPGSRGVPARVLGVGKPPKGVPQTPPTKTGKPSRHCSVSANVGAGSEVEPFAAVYQALKAGAVSVSELINVTDVCSHTLYKLLAHMRSLNLARIAQWHCGPVGDRTALWRLGARGDARRPDPMTEAELNRAYWQRRRIRQHGVRVTRALAANSSIFALAQSKPKRA